MKGLNLSAWAVSHRTLTLFLILLVSLYGMISDQLRVLTVHRFEASVTAR